MKRRKAPEAQGCKHPPERRFAGWAWDPGTDSERLWIACCACGDVLRDAFTPETAALLAAQKEGELSAHESAGAAL